MKMMKRLLAALLVFCMLFAAALAQGEQPKEEEEQKSVWDSIGGWFGQAWEDTSGWVSQAWADASKWVKGAWGDASGWVEQAWNDSSEWVTEIWGDVSSWTAETYKSASGSVSAWWVKTFNTVTASESNPWGWLTSETASLTPEMREALKSVREAAVANGEDAEAKVRSAFDGIMKQLDIADENAQKIWDTIKAYAEQKGISELAALKMSLPYLLQLKIDSGESEDSIPAVAVAQYLTGIIEKMKVSTNEAADDIVKQLNEALQGI